MIHSKYLCLPHRRYVNPSFAVVAECSSQLSSAGHETTAHTLCFCLGLLALYQDEQERTHHAIKKAIPDNRDPVCTVFDVLLDRILMLKRCSDIPRSRRLDLC